MSRKRAGQQRFPLTSKPVVLGWEIKSWITRSQARSMMDSGMARELLTETGELWGYEPCAPRAGTNAQGIGRPSAGCVTAREMVTAASMKPSKTLGMTDAQRKARGEWGRSRNLALEEHDAAEVLRAKIEAFRPKFRAAS